jgi:hypothetical protein
VRRYTNITVSDAAIHVVAPRRGELHRSSAPVQVTEAVATFLGEHIAGGLADGNARASRFKVSGPDRPEGLCRAIVASRRRFVEHSARLAQHLFDASTTETSTDTRISDGTLVVARCQADNDGEKTRFVAMLKLDPNDSFHAEVSLDKGGNQIVKLLLQPDTLPSPRERLQKAAFVGPAGGDYDALVVDKQRRGTVVSAYFLDGFLGMEEISDPATRTRTLYRTVSRVLDEVRPDLTPVEQRQLDDYLRGAMMSETIDADDLVARAPGPELVRDRLAARVDVDLPDRIFETDPEVALQLTRRRVGLGANGLKISAPSTAWADMVRVDPPQAPGDDYVVTIRTSQWKEP